jgi:F-type H+-transporting ATPase subunit delta
VSETASISLSIAGRYAQALFELAKEEGALTALEADAKALGVALAESADPNAVANAMGLQALTRQTIALMAQKRRLFVLPQLVSDLLARISTEKGEVTAEVTSAVALTPAQAEALAAALKAKVGKDVILNAAVDDTLIGGLVVKLGSTMVDTSVKAKLAALQNAMKEVG